jgi:hypothetical protein
MGKRINFGKGIGNFLEKGDLLKVFFVCRYFWDFLDGLFKLFLIGNFRDLMLRLWLMDRLELVKHIQWRVSNTISRMNKGVLSLVAQKKYSIILKTSIKKK